MFTKYYKRVGYNYQTRKSLSFPEVVNTLDNLFIIQAQFASKVKWFDLLHQKFTDFSNYSVFKTYFSIENTNNYNNTNYISLKFFCQWSINKKGSVKSRTSWEIFALIWCGNNMWLNAWSTSYQTPCSLILVELSYRGSIEWDSLALKGWTGLEENCCLTRLLSDDIRSLSCALLLH